MGTSNFNNTNASTIFAIANNDEFIWDDTRSNISHTLEEYTKDKPFDFFDNDEIDVDALRSFPATSIGELTQSLEYLGLDIHISIIPKTVAGYYEGFNLDFDIKVEGDGIVWDESDCADEILEEANYNNPELKGVYAMNGYRLQGKIDNIIENMVELTEEVFKEFSDQYQVEAQFSNGETIYSKA